MTNPTEPSMTFDIVRNGESLTVSVSGRLDAQTSPMLSDEMSGMLDGITEIVFDLRDLEYISSAGMRILFASYKLMSKRGGGIRAENVQTSVMDILEISGFASLFGMDD